MDPLSISASFEPVDVVDIGTVIKSEVHTNLELEPQILKCLICNNDIDHDVDMSDNLSLKRILSSIFEVTNNVETTGFHEYPVNYCSSCGGKISTILRMRDELGSLLVNSHPQTTPDDTPNYSAKNLIFEKWNSYYQSQEDGQAVDEDDDAVDNEEEEEALEDAGNTFKIVNYYTDLPKDYPQIHKVLNESSESDSSNSNYSEESEEEEEEDEWSTKISSMRKRKGPSKKRKQSQKIPKSNPSISDNSSEPGERYPKDFGLKLSAFLKNISKESDKIPPRPTDVRRINHLNRR